jgi:hypothetical protein
MLNDETLRLLIQSKLHNGRLSRDGIRAAWSSPSAGEWCDACDKVLGKEHLLMEGVTLDLGKRPFQMHVRCFQLWNEERRAA